MTPSASLVERRAMEARQRLARSSAVTGPDMCALVGITYRQLDYWARTDILVPSISEAHGSGTHRRYSKGDVAKAQVIKRLLDVGVSLQSVRRALPMVPEAHRDGLRWLVVSGGGEAVAVIDDPMDLATAIGEAKVAVVLDLDELPP